MHDDACTGVLPAGVTVDQKKKGRPLTTYKSHSATYTEKHYRMLIKIIITDKRENSDYVFSFTVSLSVISSLSVCAL